MIAVLGEKVVCRALKLLRYLLDYGVDLCWRSKGKAVQDLTLERPSRRLRLRIRPEDTRNTTPVMATVRVFFVVDNHAGVE